MYLADDGTWVYKSNKAVPPRRRDPQTPARQAPDTRYIGNVWKNANRAQALQNLMQLARQRRRT